MPPHAERFELPHRVEPGDIDELGHVNNVVYLRWVQDAAVAHWRALATPEQQAAVVWVASRHEIDYMRPAMPGDALILRTWVGLSIGKAFERLTEIVRTADGKVLAKARTLWVPLDAQTLKVTEVDRELRERVSIEGE